ncbi:hypothetical protein [Plantactinospora endophytica]|uniref:LPXTG cell wall anchor domain-containing protein n=1 Tax=Plantactinospora endophytica TaxID=673535 RepID=A0ABQ4EAQ1_9ACTN|nr:hypothetical protein [Plantactinospora endophytica]GIG91803.1 hypothetical protein Pen02_67390 [Plantactinospora endophytica]
MGRKLLGKVMAAAGLGAVSLLICAPGTALADDAPPKQENKGRIYTVPKGVKPGHKFKIILECDRPVERPWVSSKIIGKLSLKRVAEDNVRVPEAPPGNDDRTDGGTQPSPPPASGQPVPPNGERQAPPAGGEQSAAPGDTQPDGADTGEGADTEEGAATEEGADEQVEGGQGARAAYGAKVVYWAWAKAPKETRPGQYKASGECNSTGRIVVLPLGSVPGGDGGAASTDSTRTAAGAGLLGAAAIGGFLLIRRRRTDGSPA